MSVAVVGDASWSWRLRFLLPSRSYRSLPSPRSPSPAAAAPSEGTVGGPKLAVGGSHSCVLSAGGTVQCWGLNSSGQLGINTFATRALPVAVDRLERRDRDRDRDLPLVRAVGRWHGAVWGLNTSGQLGNNSLANSKVPVPVSGLTGVTAIAAGARHTCALVVGGTVQCWGQNTFGQLGNATLVNSKVPVVVSNVAGVTAIALGDYHSCALLVGATVKCWGLNTTGQLGNGGSANTKVPVVVRQLSGVDRDLGGRPPLVRGVDGRHGTVLGAQLVGAAREQHVGELEGAGSGEWSRHGHRDRRRLVALVRAVGRRHGALLG